MARKKQMNKTKVSQLPINSVDQGEAFKTPVTLRRQGKISKPSSFFTKQRLPQPLEP